MVAEQLNVRELIMQCSDIMSVCLYMCSLGPRKSESDPRWGWFGFGTETSICVPSQVYQCIYES